MCARYGWTLDYIYSLPYGQFLDLLDDLKDALQREYKEELTISTFGSWQITEVLKAIVQGDKYKPTEFGKYIEKLGLIEAEDKDPLEKVRLEQEKQKALDDANEIIQQFRKGRMKLDDTSI
jgi:hypothetical protein